MVQQNCQDETTISENPLNGRNKPYGAKIAVENLKVNWKGFNRQNQSTDDAESRADFWSTQDNFLYRHHNEPRVQHYVPKEKPFPIPLKYIDVTRSTYTDLDVMQEKRVGDYWNVDSNRSL